MSSNGDKNVYVGVVEDCIIFDVLKNVLFAEVVKYLMRTRAMLKFLSYLLTSRSSWKSFQKMLGLLTSVNRIINRVQKKDVKGCPCCWPKSATFSSLKTENCLWPRAVSVCRASNAARVSAALAGDLSPWRLMKWWQRHPVSFCKINSAVAMRVRLPRRYEWWKPPQAIHTESAGNDAAVRSPAPAPLHYPTLRPPTNQWRRDSAILLVCRKMHLRWPPRQQALRLFFFAKTWIVCLRLTLTKPVC